jgi:ubiquinone/menaquinone biosynthesis C-methylase UbiE
MDYEFQETKIRGFERGYRAVYVIRIGLQFGLFSALCEDPEGLTAKDLADHLCLHEPYVKIWLQTAYHFDLLDCHSRERFTLQPYLPGILGIDAGEEHISQSVGSSPLARYILTGVPAPRHRSPEESLATSRATQSVYMVFLSYLFEKHDTLKLFMNQGIRFIDIGCGSGKLIIELALAFPKSVFKGIDTDLHGLDRAESTSTALGIQDRVSFENLSAEDLDCREEYDVACMVAALHEILPVDRLPSLRNIHRALKSAGQLILLDFPYPEKLEDFRDQRYAIGIIEQFFEAPGGIVHLSASEQDHLLKQAGFTNIQRSDLHNGLFDLILAVK